MNGSWSTAARGYFLEKGTHFHKRSAVLLGIISTTETGVGIPTTLSSSTSIFTHFWCIFWRSNGNAHGFERSWGLDSYTGTAYNTTSGGTYTPNRDNGLIHTITNNANAGTVNIAAPSNYGLVIVEVTNSTAPGALATTAYNLSNGTPSTEVSAVQIAKCWRTANTNLIEWFTT